VRVTAFEQGLLPVSDLAVEASGVLNRAQAEELIEAADRIGARIASWTRPDQIRLEQYVGVVRVGDLQLEILPKIEALPEPAQVRRSLVAMLAVALDLDVTPSELVGFLEGDEPFLAALARLYCRRLLEFVRRGLRQEYVAHRETLPFARGKIDWVAHVRIASIQRVELPCVFDERSDDSILNRALKAALLEAAGLLQGSRSAAMVAELRHGMDGVSDIRPTADEIARLKTDRVNRSLEPVLVLAKLLLGNRSPDLGRSPLGRRSTFALVWDMNILFEAYVGHVTRSVLVPRECGVRLQDEAARYLARELPDGRPGFRLVPDLLIQRRDGIRLVADTKWKSLEPRMAYLGVASGDVYQLLAYARALDTGVAVLLFPHHPALGRPGVLRSFVVPGENGREVTLCIASVDLAMLDRVPDQLSELFLAEFTSDAAWLSPGQERLRTHAFEQSGGLA
jgi:5-methylcytosine-specific restriction enzyme subunit McrC